MRLNAPRGWQKRRCPVCGREEEVRYDPPGKEVDHGRPLWSLGRASHYAVHSSRRWLLDSPEHCCPGVTPLLGGRGRHDAASCVVTGAVSTVNRLIRCLLHCRSGLGWLLVLRCLAGAEPRPCCSDKPVLPLPPAPFTHAADCCAKLHPPGRGARGAARQPAAVLPPAPVTGCRGS